MAPRAIFAAAALALLLDGGRAAASSGTWSQQDWSGGASGLTAADPGDRTGWSVYESKSGTVSWATYASSGALRLNFSTLTWRGSDDSTGNTGFKKAGYSSSLRIQSSGEAAHLRLQTADPVWTSSPTLGSLPGMFDVKAAAGDLDGDGDQDLMVGANDGITYGWKNIGYSTSPIWAYWSAWNVPDVGSFARPELVDLDGDGLLDLVIGSGGGATFAYRNTGSAAGPAWTPALDWGSGNQWFPMAAPGYAVSYGGALVQDNGSIYAFPGDSNVFLRYSIANNSWATMAAPGYSVGENGALVRGTSDYIYAFVGNSQNILLRYSIANNSWATMAAPGYNITYGGALVQGTSDYIYAFVGNNQNILLRYSISNNSWATMAAPGYGAYVGAALAQGTSDYIYAFAGNPNVFLRYSIANNSWATMAAPSYTVGRGGALAQGTSDYIYAFPAGGQNVFLRYSIANDSWATMAVPGYSVGLWPYGSALASSPTVTSAIYAFPGNSQNVLLRYTPSATANLPSAAYGSPAFADLDADGDKDLFMGASDGFTYAYENQGTAASPGPWVRKTSWETNIPDVGDYSSPAFSDLDGDGDQDLVVMRQNGQGYTYRNDGTTLNPSWTYNSSWNPPNTGANGFYTGTLADLDADGKKDILIGAESSSANNADTIYAYKNTGVGGPSWSLKSEWGLNLPSARTTWLAPGGGGTSALVDLDNDNDLDLMVGGGYNNPSPFIFAYRNMGTSTSPVLAYWPSWNTSGMSSYVNHSAYADLNGDGLKDEMIGINSSGGGNWPLFAYRNTGTSTAPVFTAQSGWNTPQTFYSSSWPFGHVFGDLDGDGLADILVVDTNGIAYGIRNTGTPVAPVWTSSPTLVAGLPDIGGYGMPTLADLDDDGDLDLMMGEFVGVTYGYKNVGTPAAPFFAAQASWNSADVGNYSLPALGDLDGDGKADLLIKNSANYISAYRNTSGFLTTGDYISAVYDTGGSFDYSQVSWTGATPAGGAVTVQVRAGANPTLDGTWTAWTTFANGQDLGSAMDNKRYVQWKANMTTTDVSTSPIINDLTIEYLGYDSAPREVVSSKYNTGNAANAVRKLEWSGLPLPAGATVYFQARTSPDNASWTVWMGSDSLSSSYITNGGLLPYAARDGVDDRWLQVKAFLSGSGTTSPEVSVTSATFGAMSAPALGALTANTSTQITLDFTDNSDDEDTFRVTAATYTGANNDAGTIPVCSKPGTGACSGAVNSLTPNTSYYIRIRANEDYGQSYSPFSGEIATFTKAAPPLDQSAAYSALSSTQLYVRWGANGNPAGTKFYAERASDVDFTVAWASSGWISSTFTVLGDLSLGTTYYFRVKARNGYLVETATSALHAAQPVAAPAASQAAAVSSDTVTAAWGKSANTADASYYCERSLFSDFSSVQANSGWLRDSAQHQFAGLAINTTYYFRAKARNYAGDQTPWTVLPSTITMAAYPGYGAATVYSTSITWNWTSGGNPGGTYFTRQVSTMSDFSIFTSTARTTAVSSTTLGLLPVTLYYGRVMAENGAGVLTPGTDLGAYTTKPALPGAGSPVFTNITNNSMIVNWTAASNPTGVEYFVQKASDAAFTQDLFDSGWLSDFTYTFTGLSPTTLYYFRVKARQAGTGNESMGYTALGSTSTTPNPPLPSAAAGVSTISVTANWTANGNPAGTGFLVEKAEDAGFAVNYSSSWWRTDLLSWKFGAGISTNPYLTPNTYYYFRAKARNPSFIESPAADLPNVRTYAAVPGAPYVSNVTGSSIRFNWTPNNNPSGTEFWSEVGTSSDPWVGLTTGGWITSSYFNFTGLAEDTTHHFRVKARNGDFVDTVWTAVVSTKTVFPPQAPSAMAADLNGISSVQTDRVHVSWQDNSTTEGSFILERSADGGAFSTLVSLSADTTEYVDTGLAGAQRRYYRVKAWSSGGGDSDYAAAASTWTYPANPAPAAFTSVTAQSLRANWSANGNSSQALYVCEISTKASFTPLWASSQTYNPYADFTGLSANATHYVRVKARSGAGWESAPYTDLGSTVTASYVFSAALYDYSSSSILQGARQGFARLVVTPNGASALWSGLTVTRSGAGEDADVVEIALRKDTNASGSFEEGTDQQVAVALAFASSAAALAIPSGYQSLAGPTTYFIVMKAGDAFLSWPGNSLGVALTSASFASPNARFDAAPASFSSGLSTVTKLADVLTVAGVSVAPSPNVSRGSSNTAFLKLTAYAARDRAYLKSLRLERLGTLADAYVTAVKVYKDANANGLFEPTGDALVSSALDVFVNGVTTVTLINPSTHTVTTSQSVYFAVLDLASNAPLGATVGIRVLDAASVALMADTPDTVALAGPLDSGAPVVADPPNTLYVLGTDQAPASIQQGAQAVFEKLQLWTDAGSSLWTQLKASRSTLSLDSDYDAIKLYADRDLDGAFGSGDEPALASAGLSGGVATLNLSETVTASTRTFFIVPRISASANVVSQAGVGVQSGWLALGSGQTSVSGLPFLSSLSQIAATVDAVEVVPDAAIAPFGALQSQTGVAVLKLTARALTNAAKLSSLSLNQIGTAADSDLAAVKLYKDANGDGVFQPSDALVSGGYAFSGSTANVAFSSIQDISASTVGYFVTVDVAAAAVPGRSIRLRLENAAAVGVIAPDIASSTFPVLSNNVSIEKLTASVRVSTQSLAPASAQAGTAGVLLEKVSLRTDQSNATVNSWSLSRMGGNDSDTGAVTLYWDANANGAPEANEAVGAGTFAAGALTLAVTNAQARNVTTTAKDYYLAMDVPAGAQVGTSLAVSFISLGVAAPDGTQGGVLPFASSALVVAEPPAQLRAALESKLPASVVQGQTSVLAASMTLAASAYAVDWTGLSVLKTGTLPDAGIAALRLYRDDGNGIWGGGAEETLLAQGGFSGGAAVLAFSTQTMTSAARTFYLVADFASNAAADSTFGVELPAANYIAVAAPDSVDTAAFPWSSSTTAVTATVDTLVIDWTSLAPFVKQGDLRRAVGKFVMTASANSVELTGLRLDKTGTALDSDISGIGLYRDANADGLFQDTDALLAQTAGLINGSANLAPLSAQSVVGASAQTYFVTIDVAPTATVGLTFGLSAVAAGFSVVSPDIVQLNAPPAAPAIAGDIADSSDTVRLAFLDLASTSLYQGATGNPLARLRLSALADQASLLAVKASLTGSAALVDLGTVRLYADADGDGAFSASSDTVVASGAFASSLITLTLAAPAALTTTPRDFFLTLDVAAAASIGNTVGVSLANEGYIVLAGVDGVEAFAAQASAAGTIRDPKVPSPPVVRVLKADGAPNEGDPGYSSYETRAAFTWDGTAIAGSVERAEWCVAAAPCAAASAWTSVGLQKSAVAAGLNLTGGATYYLSVRTKNTLGAYFSDVVSRRFIVDSFKPVCAAAPTQTIEAATVKLAWPAAAIGPSGLAYYKVEERRGNSPLWVVVATTTLRSFTLTQSGMGALDVERAAGTYVYRVSAVNAAGVAGEPGPETVVQLGLAGLSGISSVSSYPNPFDSRLRPATINFTLNAAMPVKIEIYSLFGEKVRAIELSGAAGSNDVTWDGADSGGRKAPKGMYLAVISAGGMKVKWKIGVVH